MGIVEGISATIARHNGGSPSFEELWASDSESPKLDIYYREAIGDLERRLLDWVVKSSGQFDLQSAGEDYHLTLDVAASWPARLTGLLGNKIQDYLVHSVTAGWLYDFEGLTVKQDYVQMASQDLDDIWYIVGLRSFSFEEHERQGEEDKDGNDGIAGTVARVADKNKQRNDVAITAEVRSADVSKDVNGAALDAKERVADAAKNVNAEAGNVEGRHDANDASKGDGSFTANAGSRHEDDCDVDHRRPWTDWSGSHVGR